MRFEYIVLLIIAFNVVTALMQRRAKKARDAARERDARHGDGDAVNDGASPNEPRFGHREDEDGEFQDPHGERARAPGDRWEPEHSRRREQAARRRPAQDPVDPVKMPGLGRDILGQIARDLGLKTPRPAPTVPPAVVKPVPAARAPEKPKVPARIPAAPAPESPRRSPAASEAPRSRAVPGSAPSRVDLRGSDRLREAFVLKEILDAPVSRRRARS